jgi:hypothetical protein
MTQSTEVAVQDGGVPELVSPVSQGRGGLSAKHVTLPRLYKGETSGNAFKAGLVKQGTIYVAQGNDDPDPEVIASKPFTDDSEGDTVRMHVLAVKLGLSRKQPNRPLETWEYNDPSAPLDARETFDYTVVLPDVDPEIPVRVLMSSTSTKTAKRMNFTLLRLDDEERWPEVSYDLSIKKTTRTEAGKTDVWFVWQARVAAEGSSAEVIQTCKDVAQQFGCVGDITPPASAITPKGSNGAVASSGPAI